MCGIVATWASADPVALSRALDALRHRGPDGRGVWLSPDASVELGHARLAIIDPGGSPQPLVNETGDVALVVNGEFYGHDRIRHDLVRRGHRFRTGGDSEIALHLYEDHGLAFLDHLRGEFALVLYDAGSQTLIAARDRFGIKPLCYFHDARRLLLASEAKALFALGVPARWDHDAIFQVAGMQYALPDQTPFAGVKQLRPGGVLVATRAGVRLSTYWDMDRVRQDERAALPTDEARQRLLDALDEAVRLRLRSDVPLCFHLSGGLDSATIVALAARHGARPHCFSVSFDEPGYDELPQTQATARALGVELTPVCVTRRDVTDHFADAIWYGEGLAINGHLPAKYLLAREISRHAKVVLSGEGADEVLAGYAHFKLDLARATGEAMSEGGTMLAGMHLPEGEPLPLEAVRSMLGEVPAFLEAKATLGRRMRALLNDDWLQRFSGRDPLRTFVEAFDVEGRLRGRHPIDRAAYLWTRSSLANYILRTLGDGTEMAFGVEGRLPFLDHHLFAVTRRVAVTDKIRGGVEKWLLREATRGLLPDEVRRRGKHPFTAPPVGEAFMQDVLRGGAVAQVPFFDAAKIRGVLDGLPALGERERRAWDVALTLAASACVMQTRFGLG